MDNKQMIMYALLAVGVFLLAAPQQYQVMVPVPMSSSTKQIVAVVALLAAYYYYNGEKLF